MVHSRASTASRQPGSVAARPPAEKPPRYVWMKEEKTSNFQAIDVGLAVNQSYENSEQEKQEASKKDSLAFLKSTSTDFKTAVPVLSLYNHLVIYLFLPIAKKSVALVFGAVCSLICMILFVAVELSLVFLSVFFKTLYRANKATYLQREEDEWNAWQIAQQCLADLVFYISLNFVGFYVRYVNEINMRRGFLDKRSCIETTFKLKYEKEQEVIYFLACASASLYHTVLGR